MTSMIRWDPLAELTGLRRAMNRSLYGRPSIHVWRNADAGLGVPVDVFETDTNVVVKAALPGLNPEDVEASVSDGVLTLKGETKADEKSEGENYYRREIRYGSFSRSIPMPVEVVGEKAEAEFKDGVLTVTLPKAEEARPKTIKITAGATPNGTKSK